MLAAITAVVHLTVRGGNRVGAVVGNGSESYRIPALGGRNHARHLVRRIAATRRADSAAAAPSCPRCSSRCAGRRADAGSSRWSPTSSARPATGELPWERPLRALALRHQLLGIEVLDPRELELPAGRAGDLRRRRDRT